MIYTVKEVHGEPREWSSKQGGTFLSYTVDFVDQDGMRESGVEWTKKPESQPPHTGEMVAGHIEPGKFSEKFKIDYEATKELSRGGSYEASSGTSGASNHSPKGSGSGRDIDASIARQVALKIVAPLIIEEKGLHRTTKEVVHEIEGFILEAGREPQSFGAVVAQAVVDKVDSLDFSGARKEEPIPTVDRDHIMQLLSSAGLVYAGAQEKVADYLMGPLTVEGRAQKALSGLQDLDRQGNVLAQLKTATEAWTKQPLPQGDALDGSEDPPF